MQILIVAATVSLSIGIWKEGIDKGWYEGVTIYLAILIIVSITATNDYLKDKQFRRLMAVRKERQALVIRDNGVVQTISTYDLLVGDIILVKQGDHVPCDCLIIESDELQTDESNITGESDHVKKAPLGIKNQNPILLGDSMIVLGKGTAVVCAVGILTQTGEVEERLFADETEGTPLQQKLERVATFIGRVGMFVSLLTMLSMMLNLVIGRILSNQPILHIAMTSGLVNAVIVGITIVVVAVPEGLPLAVTISLAYSVNQMRRENNLVRRLEAAETMGGANEILTDKTGTLTQNRMTVAQLYAEQELQTGLRSLNLSSQELILTGCSVNSNSHILKKGDVE
jgi:Ca2+ transporting ATPase